MTDALHFVGRRFLTIAEEVGGMAVLFGQIIKNLFPPRLDPMETT